MRRPHLLAALAVLALAPAFASADPYPPTSPNASAIGPLLPSQVGPSVPNGAPNAWARAQAKEKASASALTDEAMDRLGAAVRVVGGIEYRVVGSTWHAKHGSIWIPVPSPIRVVPHAPYPAAPFGYPSHPGYSEPSSSVESDGFPHVALRLPPDADKARAASDLLDCKISAARESGWALGADPARFRAAATACLASRGYSAR